MRKIIISIVLAMVCASAYGAEFLSVEGDKYRFFDNGIERLCTQPESFDNGRTAVTECETNGKVYLCIAMPDYMGYLDCNGKPISIRLQVFS